MRPTAPLIRSEAGASLVEIIMALGILATVLIALGGLMFQVANHTRHSAIASHRSAALSGEAAWAQGLAWEVVDTLQSKCDTRSAGPITYSRCVFVTHLSPAARRVTVVLTPTGALAGLPDTVVVDRTKPRLPSPLRTE